MTDRELLTFVPLDEQPHDTAVLGCDACGHYWVGVWPHRTAVARLQCPSCFVVGRVVVDPPRNAADPVEGG
jgi:hypothetical protein